MLKKILLAGVLGIGLLLYLIDAAKKNRLQGWLDENQGQGWAPAIQYNLAYFHEFTDDLMRAATAYQRLYDRYPEKYGDDALFRVGDNLEKMKRFTEAKEIYKRYVEKYPKGKHTEMIWRRVGYLREYR